MKLRKILLGFAALGIFVGGIAYAQTQVREGSAAVTRVDYVEAHEPQDQVAQCRSGDTYADMPDVTQTFQVGGGQANEAVIIIHLQNTESAGSGQNFIRLLIDNQVQPGSGSEFMIRSTTLPNQYHIDSWTFVTAPLSPGTHVAKIQWRSDPSEFGNFFCVNDRSMTILHR